MAKMTIRSTYSFDAETVQKLDRLAEHWNTSKSEVLRRAVDKIAEQTLRDREDASRRSMNCSGGLPRPGLMSRNGRKKPGRYAKKVS